MSDDGEPEYTEWYQNMIDAYIKDQGTILAHRLKITIDFHTYKQSIIINMN